MTHRWLISFSAAVLFWSSELYAADILYRYKDKSGGIILNEYIPPEYVALGYTVLNSQGMVIRVVPPALTADEINRQEKAKKEKAVKDAKRKKQLEEDERLLRIYSVPEDVERALERKLASIDVFIQSKQGVIQELLNQKQKIQAKAADLERSGKDVPSHLLVEMKALQQMVADHQSIIDAQENEKKVQRHRFQQDLERLKQLLKPGSNQARSSG